MAACSRGKAYDPTLIASIWNPPPMKRTMRSSRSRRHGRVINGASPKGRDRSGEEEHPDRSRLSAANLSAAQPRRSSRCPRSRRHPDRAFSIRLCQGRAAAQVERHEVEDRSGRNRRERVAEDQGPGAPLEQVRPLQLRRLSLGRPAGRAAWRSGPEQQPCGAKHAGDDERRLPAVAHRKRHHHQRHHNGANRSTAQ